MNSRFGSLAVASMAALVLSGWVAPVARGEPAAAVSDEVRRLVTDLAAPTRAVRNEAAHRLLELGPAALPHLPPPELLPSVSVREAVGRIRQELERRQAITSTEATRLTLSGAQTLGGWLRDVERQTGNRLDDRRLPEALLEKTLTFKNRSGEFWPLLGELATRAGFAFDGNGVERALPLSAVPDRAEPSQTIAGYAGAFRLVASPATIVPLGRNEKPGTQDSRRRLARVRLSIQAEPRLRPLFLQYAAAEVVASAEDGERLSPFSPEAKYELPARDSGGKSSLQLDYLLPAGAIPAKIDLTGKLRMTVAAGSAPIRFEDVAGGGDLKSVGVSRRRGGVTVTLERARNAAGTGGARELRVRVAIAYDSGGPAFESHRTWMQHNEVYLEMADGTRLPVNGGFESTLEADGGAGIEYRFVGLPDPLPMLSFVYVAPLLIVDVPVEFAIESIPVNPTAKRN